MLDASVSETRPMQRYAYAITQLLFQECAVICADCVERAETLSGCCCLLPPLRPKRKKGRKKSYLLLFGTLSMQLSNACKPSGWRLSLPIRLCLHRKVTNLIWTKLSLHTLCQHLLLFGANLRVTLTRCSCTVFLFGLAIC